MRQYVDLPHCLCRQCHYSLTFEYILYYSQAPRCRAPLPAIAGGLFVNGPRKINGRATGASSTCLATTATCGVACFSFGLILFLKRSSLTKSWIQDLLTDTQAFWGYFQKLIGIDEVQALLQAHDLWRCQL